jgi:hypothetical protein
MRFPGVVKGVLISAVLSVAAPATAQTTASGSIAGSVVDSSGSALPGVTVEAASPALIEKVRTVVSDARGEYKIVDLRPGTYTVTFALAGFSTFKREGIELTTGFTATANAELRVGALEETITVSGANPMVDVQNVRTQAVFSRQLLDALPTGKTQQAFTALTLGAKVALGAGTIQDVGGNQGEQGATIVVHGSPESDGRMMHDGMYAYGGLDTNGSSLSKKLMVNQVAVQEVTVQLGNAPADTETGGMVVNIVPRDGSSTLKGHLLGSGSSPSLQADNLSPELQARGLTSAGNQIKQMYDFGIGLGGPVRKDHVWFFYASRWWGIQQYLPGAFYNATQHSTVYTPDPSRPAFQAVPNKNPFNLRVTWQVTPKQKVALSEQYQSNCNCNRGISATVAPEAGFSIFYRPLHLAQATWSYTATNRLLFEAGVSLSIDHYATSAPENLPSAVTATDVPMFEQSRGLAYNAKLNRPDGSGGEWNAASGGNSTDNGSGRLAASYVTGSHAFKAGFMQFRGVRNTNMDLTPGGGVRYNLRNGLPVSIDERLLPIGNRERMNSLGFYGQDQWTVRKLTLNLGLRFDYLNESVPAFSIPAGPLVPARSYPAVNDVARWKDINPRLGAAYDLFGDGRTAIKASLGRYVISETTSAAERNNPSMQTVFAATRTWGDANGNFVPDCTLSNPLQNGECGQVNNLAFGSPVANTIDDPSLLSGWGVRSSIWESSASIQHEVRRGLVLNAAYFHTAYVNINGAPEGAGGNTGGVTPFVAVNQAVSPTDFTPYCVTQPADGRLPGGGGKQICGLFDVSAAKFGRVSTLNVPAANVGKAQRSYNGADISVSTRFGEGGSFGGGVGFGQTVTDQCYVNDSPQITVPTINAQSFNPNVPRTNSYCRIVPPWSAGTQIKLNGIYPLPWKLQLSGVFQSLPGIPIAADNVYTNAQIAPSLGRNLAACGSATLATCTATVTIPSLAPQTAFEDRLVQLDLRLTKMVKMRRARLQANVELYNLFNKSTILGEVTTYGPTWLRPTSVLGPRTLKLGAQLEF